VKIFGIGLNKTGTTTLGYCFRELGFNHKSYDLKLLKHYHNNNMDPIFKTVNQFDVFEDWPWPLLYKMLDKKYNNARFILTVRKDPETWYGSLRKHADRTGPTHARQIVVSTRPTTC